MNDHEYLKLKPCPFCGEKARYRRTDDGYRGLVEFYHKVDCWLCPEINRMNYPEGVPKVFKVGWVINDAEWYEQNRLERWNRRVEQ